MKLVGLEDATDIEIFRFAGTHDYGVVTFDSDFVDLNALHGSPPKIISLNTGNLSTKNITQLPLDNILMIQNYLSAKLEDILGIIK